MTYNVFLSVFIVFIVVFFFSMPLGFYYFPVKKGIFPAHTQGYGQGDFYIVREKTDVDGGPARAVENARVHAVVRGDAHRRAQGDPQVQGIVNADAVVFLVFHAVFIPAEGAGLFETELFDPGAENEQAGNIFYRIRVAQKAFPLVTFSDPFHFADKRRKVLVGQDKRGDVVAAARLGRRARGDRHQSRNFHNPFGFEFFSSGFHTDKLRANL